MKLFLSALLLAAMPAAFAQNQPVPSSPDLGVAGMAASNGRVYPFLQRVCPLDFTAASVTSPAGYLPVSQRRPDDGTLTLHFRNESGKTVQSASITATVKVKTNIYALDAHPIALQLTFTGADINRDLDQLREIQLPRHFYVFGLAQVSLERVTYADGTSWIAPPQGNSCRTNGLGIKSIEAK
jgi:hypothetical protein